MAAIGIDAGRRRAMEIGDAKRVFARRHAYSVADRAFINAFARGEDPAGQIGDRSDFQFPKIFRACRQIEMNGFEVGHLTLPPPPLADPIRRWSGAYSR